MNKSELNQLIAEIVSDVLDETAPDFANMASQILHADEAKMLSGEEAVAKAVSLCNQYITRASAAITARLLVRLGVISLSPE